MWDKLPRHASKADGAVGGLDWETETAVSRIPIPFKPPLLATFWPAIGCLALSLHHLEVGRC